MIISKNGHKLGKKGYKRKKKNQGSRAIFKMGAKLLKSDST